MAFAIPERITGSTGVPTGRHVLGRRSIEDDRNTPDRAPG